MALKKSLLVGLLSTATLLLGAGCGGEVQEQEVIAASFQGTEKQEAALSSDQGVTFWPRRSVIPVCFMNPDWEFVEQKRQIKEAVEKTWMHVADLRIVGWGTCPYGSSEQFVTVTVTSNDAGSGGSAATVGMSGALRTREQSEATRPSIHIAFSNDPALHTLGRLEYLAVHEFGHILGFSHEQDRSDNPYSGSDTGTPDYCRNHGPTSVTTYHTGFDRDSVMNYCNKYWNNQGYLSPSDVVGVQRLYGRKNPKSLVSFDGRCVDVPDGTNADGNDLQTYDCSAMESIHQKWVYNAVAQSFRWLLPDGTDSGRVMDVEWGSTEPGTPVQLYQANGTSAQEWNLWDVEIKGLGGLCLQAQSSFWGHSVRLAQCNGSAAQRFSVHADSTIRHWDTRSGQEMCLEFYGTTSPANGSRVRLGTCSSGWNQQWSIGSFGMIRPFAGERYCLDSDAHNLNQFTGVIGTGLQLYECIGWYSYSNVPLHQQFQFSGEIRNRGGCLDVFDARRENGTPIIRNSCNGSASQKWDYYP